MGARRVRARIMKKKKDHPLQPEPPPPRALSILTVVVSLKMPSLLLLLPILLLQKKKNKVVTTTTKKKTADAMRRNKVKGPKNRCMLVIMPSIVELVPLLLPQLPLPPTMKKKLVVTENAASFPDGGLMKFVENFY